MRDVSVGGALLELEEPLLHGEEIQVEVHGDCSAFTMDAIVMRSLLARCGSSIGIRFVERDPNSYHA
jgi:hypothetical protein